MPRAEAPRAEAFGSGAPTIGASDPGLRNTWGPETEVLNTAARGTPARHGASSEPREGPDHPRLVRSGGGEEERFREFVAERWLALLRTAYLLTGDHGHAEDLVQNALIRVHRHWAKIERSGSPEGYVRRVMFNLHTDWWRRIGSRERAVRLTADIEHPASADAYASFDLRDELWEALRALPAKMRATLVLRYFEDLGEAETAQILGCSIGTVKSQTSRGLQRLQQALSAQPASASSSSSSASSTSSPELGLGRERDLDDDRGHAPTAQPSTERAPTPTVPTASPWTERAPTPTVPPASPWTERAPTPTVPPASPSTEHLLVALRRRPEQWPSTQFATENSAPRTPSQSSSPQPSAGLAPAVRRLDPPRSTL
ncbi:SigE family RNA polymerase sigma factor [Actinospica durhamensis]|uniref:SigE family RNA polymerase sigma factor n=1 Tax=Actinospica durhamensis TaxID=1508375 RepID=UPI0027DB8C65|nr:SigE family RNA polymerase sigma factor [Actinospica durhamensis]